MGKFNDKWTGCVTDEWDADRIELAGGWIYYLFCDFNPEVLFFTVRSRGADSCYLRIRILFG